MKTNMDYAVEVAKIVENELGGKFKAHAEVCLKNGVEKLAVIVAPNSNVSAVFYLNEAEASPRNVAESIVSIMNGRKASIEDPEAIQEYVSQFKDKEKLLQSVSCRLLGGKRAEAMKERYPHKEYLDLTVFYNIVSEDGSYAILITDPMMEMAGVTLEELDTAAANNTKFNYLPFGGFGNFGMIACVNGNCESYGASILLYPRAFAGLALRADSDLYLIPSSIHEVLAVSANEVEADMIQAFCQGANGNPDVINETDVLCSTIYRYRKDENVITIEKRGEEQ